MLGIILLGVVLGAMGMFCGWMAKTMAQEMSQYDARKAEEAKMRQQPYRLRIAPPPTYYLTTGDETWVRGQLPGEIVAEAERKLPPGTRLWIWDGDGKAVVDNHICCYVATKRGA